MSDENVTEKQTVQTETKKSSGAVLPPKVQGRDGKGERFATPQYAPGQRQFQPNNKQTTIQTNDGLVDYRPDWATKLLIKEGQGIHIPRRLRDRAKAMLAGTGKFAKKRPSNKPTGK